MCLFRDSPPITSREQSENDENKRRVVNWGRNPELHLLVHNTEQPFRPLAHDLFNDMAPFATMLDSAYGGERYAQTLDLLRQRVDAPDTTPAAVVLEGARAHGGLIPYTLLLSRQHQQSLLAQPLDADTKARFAQSATTSLLEQAALEALPQGSFDDFVARYYQ